ncbi:MAG: acyl-CoA carboxylase epsilon subunit [Thermocrispum sp.]
MESDPVVRVVRGNPDDVELAALVAVVAALAGKMSTEPLRLAAPTVAQAPR